MKNKIVGFTEEAKKKFAGASERLFLYDSEVANCPEYVLVRGFRGRFTVSEQLLIERKSDLRELTDKEIVAVFAD